MGARPASAVAACATLRVGWVLWELPTAVHLLCPGHIPVRLTLGLKPTAPRRRPCSAGPAGCNTRAGGLHAVRAGARRASDLGGAARRQLHPRVHSPAAGRCEGLRFRVRLETGCWAHCACWRCCSTPWQPCSGAPTPALLGCLRSSARWFATALLPSHTASHCPPCASQQAGEWTHSPFFCSIPPHQSMPRSHPGTLPRALPQHTTRPCLLAPTPPAGPPGPGPGGAGCLDGVGQGSGGAQADRAHRHRAPGAAAAHGGHCRWVVGGWGRVGHWAGSRALGQAQHVGLLLHGAESCGKAIVPCHWRRGSMVWASLSLQQ